MSLIRVDFYLLDSAVPADRWYFACRFLEKAYAHKHRVFVYCEHQSDAQTLDELLWTFKPGSFIPHHLQGEGPTPPPPIQIATDPNPGPFNDILMNLSNSVPACYTRFKRIVECVLDDEAAKAQSREHYRHYREAQCQLFTHSVTAQSEQ